MSIFIIFISALFVQQIYHLFVFSRIAFFKSPLSASKVLLPISLVVCCKNEKSNLEKHFPSFIAQQYDDFEVLIIDDSSTDGTKEFVEEMILKFPQRSIRYLSIEKRIPGKKEVLYHGVKATKNEFILVTDADCKPSTNQWMQHMVEAVQAETSIVLGYAPFNVLSGNFVNLLSRYENFVTACFYLSFAMAKIPYMGVGRNMLFKRSLYLETFDRIVGTNTLSGDDDLFIQYAANRENCEVCLVADAFLYSDTKTNWKDFLQQKARHLSTGFHYNWSNLFALSMYPFTMLVIVSSYICMLFWQSDELLFASVILFIYLDMIWQLKKRAAKMLLFTSHFPLLIMDIFFLLYQIILVILPFKTKKERWQANKSNPKEPKMTQHW